MLGIAQGVYGAGIFRFSPDERPSVRRRAAHGRFRKLSRRGRRQQRRARRLCDRGVQERLRRNERPPDLRGLRTVELRIRTLDLSDVGGTVAGFSAPGAAAGDSSGRSHFGRDGLADLLIGARSCRSCVRGQRRPSLPDPRPDVPLYGIEYGYGRQRLRGGHRRRVRRRQQWIRSDERWGPAA